MKTLEISTALAILALAGVAFFGTSELSIWDDVSPGPRFMPTAVALVATVVAIGLFFSALGKTGVPAEGLDATARRRVLLTAAAIGGFVAAIPVLGFVPSATLLVLFILLVALRRRVVPSLAATAITVGLIQGVFVTWLRIPLPKGPLGL